jgi:hypothetical protein
MMSVGLAGCSGAGDTSIADHQAEWTASHPEQYVIEVRGTGFVPGRTVAAVSGGHVVAARVGITSSLEQADPATIELPVEQLFRSASQNSGCKLATLSFDEQYGYVTEYFWDCGEEGGGEKVTCFKPATIDLSACEKP